MNSDILLLGQTLGFAGDPFQHGPDAARIEARGGVLIRDGRILATGTAHALRAAHPQAQITDHGEALIMAGFIDAHVHYPQTAMIASWGKRLIDWLHDYTFPEERRFENPAYASEIAGRYLDLTLANGT
ncbi:MAG: imidazolonepropionase-like domain-containing protein, partial [Thalassovita sp.]